MTLTVNCLIMGNRMVSCYSCLSCSHSCFLFARGRKWNPLRQRLDSYDYTVKQHVVGSLLFPPLLLLLPTTSVFYIFFSIVDSMVSLICLLIEFTISVVHATPYVKILLWLVSRRRFPSGIWFEIMHCQDDTIDSTQDIKPPSKNTQGKDINSGKSSFMLSFLHSNLLSVGETLSFLFIK